MADQPGHPDPVGPGVIKNTPGYGSPAVTYAKWLARSPHWYSEGGLVPGYASGGQVGTQGAAWLKAWQDPGAAAGSAPPEDPSSSRQIARMRAAIGRAKALAGAAGLSPGQHRFWAAAAADETRRLGVPNKELTTERAWRSQLGLNELELERMPKAPDPGLAAVTLHRLSCCPREMLPVTGIGVS